MAFDDDDDVSKQTPPQNLEEAQDDDEEALEDEAQDFRHFAALQRKNISAQQIRRGEKDFESHGTQSQASALEQSRRAMEDVLSYTRVHNHKDWVRGWYFPSRWATAEDLVWGTREQGEREGWDKEKTAKIEQERATERREYHLQDRVICLSTEHKTLGRRVKGLSAQQPGYDQVWLLPEEALFLMERGSLDLWWPTATMKEIFPIDSEGATSEKASVPDPKKLEEEDEFALGFPLSLQAAYSLLIGQEGERGKVTLRNLQVYSNLNRPGFHVLRAPPPEQIPPTALALPTQALWQRLYSLLFSTKEITHPAYGPLVTAGLYRSYASIYARLAIIPRHKPNDHPPAHPSTIAHSPFRIQYHMWKPGTPGWSKTKPPTAPEHYLAIVDANDTSVPTGQEICALLDTMPYAPPPSRSERGGRTMHQRLKHGHRNVLVAVVDHGVINYMRFAEGAFSEEPLYPLFDANREPRGGKGRGGKRGGRGGGRGRGRGGRG